MELYWCPLTGDVHGFRNEIPHPACTRAGEHVPIHYRSGGQYVSNADGKVYYDLHIEDDDS
jgi:hypothetical protein